MWQPMEEGRDERQLLGGGVGIQWRMVVLEVCDGKGGGLNYL